MKILLVRSYCPHKIFYGGDMRVSQFVDYFSRFAEMDLLTLTKPYEGCDPDYVKRTFKRHFYFETAAKDLGFLKKIMHLLPWQLTEFYSEENQEIFNRIIEEGKYDFLFASKLQSVLYFLRLPKKWHKKVIIDFDDILSQLYAQHYRDFWTAQKNSFFLRINEARALKNFNRVFVCAQVALNAIDRKYHNKVGIVPNIYPYAENSFSPSKDKNRLLFVGSLDYFPNVEGLKWFLETIWIGIKKVYPGLKLSVVGKTLKGIPEVSAMLGTPEDAEYFLNAPSITSHYENCFASVVPLLNGGGTRLKILESAAYGRPVLTTVKGMEGLDFEKDKQILLFEDVGSFTASYQKLLDDNLYKNIAEAALKVLHDFYSKAAFEKSMDENWNVITDIKVNY